MRQFQQSSTERLPTLPCKRAYDHLFSSKLAEAHTSSLPYTTHLESVLLASASGLCPMVAADACLACASREANRIQQAQNCTTAIMCLHDHAPSRSQTTTVRKSHQNVVCQLRRETWQRLNNGSLIVSKGILRKTVKIWFAG